MPGPSKVNDPVNIPRGVPNMTRLIMHSDPDTGIGLACTTQELLGLVSGTAPSRSYVDNADMLANTNLGIGYFAYVYATDSLYLYNGGDRADLAAYILIASGGGGSGGGLDADAVGEGLAFEEDKVKLGGNEFPVTNPITGIRYVQLNEDSNLIFTDEHGNTIAMFCRIFGAGTRAVIRAVDADAAQIIALNLDFTDGAKFLDSRTVKKGIEYSFSDYTGLTDDSLITKKVLDDALADVGGGGGAAQLRFRFNSSLYTEDEHLFVGPVTALAATKSFNLTSFSFQVKLDDSSTTWIACSDVAAVLAWVAVNVTLPATAYWVKCLVNYGSAIGVAEVLISYS
jgi:hypothetical protein